MNDTEYDWAEIGAALGINRWRVQQVAERAIRRIWRSQVRPMRTGREQMERHRARPDVTAEMIATALEATGGNVTYAARLLGISRQAIAGRKNRRA